MEKIYAVEFNWGGMDFHIDSWEVENVYDSRKKAEDYIKQQPKGWYKHYRVKKYPVH